MKNIIFKHIDIFKYKNMLIDITNLITKYNLNINGILHIGAHLCEEKNKYEENNINNVLWIEGNTNIVNKVKDQNQNIYILNYLVGDKNEENCKFNISNNGQSSSVLELGRHKILHPEVKYINHIYQNIYRLDYIYKKEKINENQYNFINLDIQGYELNALKGLGNILNNFEYVYTEVNKTKVYENCCLIEEIDEYLNDFNFKRVDTKWYNEWGDAFYIKIKK